MIRIARRAVETIDMVVTEIGIATGTTIGSETAIGFLTRDQDSAAALLDAIDPRMDDQASGLFERLNRAAVTNR
jgi:hypothetical protein